jgi:hypothetical protein
MSATTLSASRVLPTPPGPTAVTRRCSSSAAARAARSATRPTNDVNGEGSRAATAAGGSRRHGAHGRRRCGQRPTVAHLEFAQQRRDVTLDDPDGDEQPGPISAFVRCSASAASTSPSRADTPATDCPPPPSATFTLCIVVRARLDACSAACGPRAGRRRDPLGAGRAAPRSAAVPACRVSRWSCS